MSRDAQGTLSFVDPLFRDALYRNGGAAAPARAPARTAAGRLRSSAPGYQWSGSGVDYETEIRLDYRRSPLAPARSYPFAFATRGLAQMVLRCCKSVRRVELFSRGSG